MMKYAILLSFLFSLISYSGYSQPNFYYHSKQHINATATAGTSSAEVRRDAAGNFFSAGVFSGTTDFDPGAGVSNLSTTGYLANYIAKYNPSGALLWAKKIETEQQSGSLLLHGICVDNAGALIIFGAVLGTVDMDPGAGTFYITEINQANGYPPGDYDPFVAKYDANGNFLWAWAIGAVHPNCGPGCVDFNVADVEVDAANNLFVLGDFQNNAYFDFDFDPTGGTANIPDNGFTDVFIAKYTPGGAYIKAINLGGDSDDIPSTLQMTSGGTVTVTGGFRGTGDFNPGNGTATMSSNGPNADVFAARYTAADLNYVWAVGGQGSVSDNEIYGRFKEDAAGNLYITSSIQSLVTADFDPGPGVFNITGQGNGDIVFLKLTSTGGFVWAKHMATSSYEGVLDVDLDANQNPWYCFRFYGNLDIDPGAGSTVLNSNGVGSVIVKYTPSGDLSDQVFDFSGQNDQNYYELTRHYFYNNTTLLVNGRLKGSVDVNPDPGIENVTSSAASGTWNLVKLTTSQLWVTPNNQSVPGTAGTTTFAVTSNAGWTASSSANWLTISPLSGTNNGILTVNYTANDGDMRTANILVSSGGQTRTVTVTQATGLICQTFMSVDVPKTIDGNSANTVLSNLNIPLNATIADLEVVNLNIAHGWISDLTVKLKSPANTLREMFYEICSQGYAQSMNASFDDEVSAVPGANCPTILAGPYHPVQSFSAFDGQNSAGNWTLSVYDISPQIGGTLNSWGVKACYFLPPSGLSVNIASTNVTCNGLANGTATANASGGTSGYSYLWSNGATSASVSNLAPGNYTVTVTSGSETATASTTITQPAVLLANVTGNSNNGSASSAPSGGTAPYTFLWSNGQTFQTIENLSIGVYTCTTTDDQGCTAIGMVTLTPSCGMPLNLYESDLTASTVKLHWANMGATQYQVQFKENGMAWQTSVLTDTFLIKNNLNPYKVHTWRVRAKCGTSWTIYSPGRTFTTPQSGSTCSSPTNLVFSNITSSSALADWAPSSGATSYQIRRKAVATGSSWVTAVTAADQYQFTGLISDMTYSVQVRTKCGSTWFPWTPVYNFHTFISFATADDRQADFAVEETDSPLLFFPNPAHEEVFLKFQSDNIENDDARLEVFDISGRLIFNDLWMLDTGENLFRISVDDWQPGVYVLRMFIGDQLETKLLTIL